MEKNNITRKRSMNMMMKLLGAAFFILHSSFFVSCEDFFDQESDRVIYTNADHLSNWTDTVYSMTGILNKLQVIADRTILFGEVRGDLVSLTNDANSDLRDIATFSVGNDNQYNRPRDYYAIINNCNYFIAHTDTAMKSNRNEYIFMKEYAQVKAIRAWTYLQLALNYGSVPFVTEPILTKEESERDYPRRDLASICEYFLEDLSTLPERYDYEYPDLGDNVRGNYSRVLFFPLNVVRGDLSLYLGSTKGRTAGKADFERAAQYYYKYISHRNGLNSYYPTSCAFTMWEPGTTSWNSFLSFWDRADVDPVSRVSYLFTNENYSATGELVTMIPGDSIRAEGNYSELRNLFVSREENDYKVSITPSDRMIEISEAQVNVAMALNLRDSVYAPTDLTNHRAGDLRLSVFWNESEQTDAALGTRITVQDIGKYVYRNVRIYRRQMIYLRWAEALNMAGYPRVAYKVLERGVNNKVLLNEVYPYLNESDSTWVANNMDFPTTYYRVLEAEDLTKDRLGPGNDQPNTMGMHSRGSGWTPMNDTYRLVGDSVETDPLKYEQIKAEQQAQVDSLIINEGALELCFEGTRFYDLMRYAMRQDNPGETMAKFVYARRGEANCAAVQGEIRKSLLNPQNWYLQWDGKVGFNVNE